MISRNIDLSGMHRAKVIDNVDPDGRGRLLVHIPILFVKDFDTNANDEDKTSFDIISPGLFHDDSPFKQGTIIKHSNGLWANNCMYTDDALSDDIVSGSYRIPRKESWVYIFFENNDIQKPRWMPFMPTMNSTELNMENLVDSQEMVADPKTKVNIDVIRQYSNGTVIYTDNNEEVESFIIKHHSGHTLRIKNNGEFSHMEMVTATGQMVHINDITQQILVYSLKDIRMYTGDGQSVIIDAGSGSIKAKANKQIEATTGSSKINMTSSGNISAEAGSKIALKVGGSSIELTPGGVTINGPVVKIN